jgi:hypothetical protein
LRSILAVKSVSLFAFFVSTEQNLSKDWNIKLVKLWDITGALLKPKLHLRRWSLSSSFVTDEPTVLNKQWRWNRQPQIKIFVFRRLECTIKEHLTLLARAVDASKVKVWVKERNMPAA